MRHTGIIMGLRPRSLSTGEVSAGDAPQDGIVIPGDGGIPGDDPGDPAPQAGQFRYYCGDVVYDMGTTRLLTDEGYVTFSSDGTPQYHYYLRDHLGNVRVVFDQTGTVEQVNHYYAFGGLMRESTNPGVQPYKYGGKELDRTSGLDAYDFGARSYFADRLQWSTMDPLCEKYYDVTPYGYCSENPINYIDNYGEDWVSFIIDDFMWAYYDSRIHSQEDIEKYYYTKGNNGHSSIKYVGTEGFIYNSNEGEKTLLYKLNSDGTYTDSYGEISVEEKTIVDDYGVLHIGNNILDAINKNFGSNWYGTYLGPNNPTYKNGAYSYAKPPIDELDFAAYLHDREYDMYHAEGPIDVISNLDVVHADYRLYQRAKNVYQSAPKDSSMSKWARNTSYLFKRVASFKFSLKSLF